MFSWLAKRLISYNMARSRTGDIEPTLRMEAADVTLRFPGDNSWGGEFRGKAQVRQWLQRLVAVGLQVFPDEVVMAGWPWRSTVCVRGTDHLKDESGELVYENRYVIWGHLRWGKLVDYEVYEDTEKARALDDWLAEHRPEMVPA
jgi:ketosteroid isomerase-like protein